MTIEQAIKLTGHAAWPFVALIGLFVLLPYLTRLLRAAADLRDLLDRSGEMVGLVSQVTALTEAMADLKAMEQFGRAGRADTALTPERSDVENLWKQLERQWQETRDSFRASARLAGVPVSFIGTVGVRDATKTLVEKGVIDAATAGAMTDLSSQYQLMYRTTTARSEYLNEKVLATYTATATRVRAALKAAT
jgi:hypothetical protein